MPTLAFKVQADYEKVMRLREEIHKLKEEMKGVDAVNNPHQFNVLNQNLQKCTKEYNNLTTEAVKAGTQIESGFKKKIYDAQQVVNKFSEDIMAQKKIVFDTAEEFRNLTARYNELRRQGKKMSAEGMVPQLNRVKSALDEQKRSLFELTQERSKSQLGLKKLREEYQLFAKESGASTGILAKLKQEITGLGMSMMAGWGLKELGAQIIRVRGQFQQADTAIQTLLGSKERADDLLAKVREYAKISPLEFGDITRATLMMLGFNIEAEKVPGFIKAIGDVSMGESSRFNSLTLAFSQMSATGKLMGQDLLQMINAGFNPLTVMAEKTGKSVAQLKEEMSKGAISAEMVQQAFIDATSAGGKFYNMSENAAKTINGQLSMMHDALDAAMNDIGKASEGVIINSISGVTKLIENYETMGRVLLGLATTYGSYRTALALVTFAENGHTLSMTIARAQILLTQKAQALLNATMLANPYVLAAVALGGLVGTLIATSDGLSSSERAQKDFNAAIDEGTQKQQEYNAETEKAISTANNDTAATNDRRDAMNLLIHRYPEIIQKYIDEEGHLKNILQLKREIAAIDGQRTYENLKNTAQRYKDAAEAARLMINGKKLTEEQQKLLAEVKQEYFDKNNWQAKALFKNSDLLDYTEQMSKSYSKQADRTNTENYIKKYQETITKFSKDQLTKLQSVLQAAKTKGNKVALPNVAGLNGLVLNQADIASLDTYVGGLLKAKDDTITKKTLSDRKKKLQAELDALTYEEAAGRKGAELKKKIEDIDKKLNVYSTNKKSGTKTSTEEKTESISRQQKLAQVRAAKDLEFSTREAEIKAMKDGMAKRLEQIELNKDKEMEAISRSYEDLKENRINEAKKLWDADPKNKGKNFYDSEAFSFAASDERYTEEEKKNLSERQKAVQAEYLRSVDSIKKEEIQSLRDYLKEYGTIQEKKYALAQEYDERIANSTNEWQKKKLEAEKDAAMSTIDVGILKTEIDWSLMFDGLGDAFQAEIKQSVDKIEQYMKTADFKLLDPTQKKEIVDLRNNLSAKTGSSVGTFNFSIYKEIGKNMKEYQDALLASKEAQRNHSLAVLELTQAAKELENAEKQEKEAHDKYELAIASQVKAEAQKKKSKAEQKVQTTGKVQKEAEGRVVEAQGNLQKSTTEARKAVDNFSDAIKQMTNGTLRGFADGLVNLINAIKGNGLTNGLAGLGSLSSKTGRIIEDATDISDNISRGLGAANEHVGDAVSNIDAMGEQVQVASKEGKSALSKTAGVFSMISTAASSSGEMWGMIVGAILDILDSLGDDPGGFIDELLTKIFGVIEGIIEQVGNGQFLGKIVRAIVEGIGHIIEQLFENIINDTVRAFSFDGPFGGLSDSLLGIFGLGATEESYEEAKERYDQLADVWDELIDKKKAYLSESWGTEAISASEEALRLLRAEQEANRIIAERRLGEGASWGSHSYGYRMWGGSYTSKGEDNLGLTNSGILARYAGEINWNDVNQAVRRGLINAGLGNVEFDSMDDLLKMNADQLNWIKENYTGLWTAMDDDFRQALENVIQYSEQEAEIIKQLQEQITGTSFDTVFDQFMSGLNDLASGSKDVMEDIAENWQKMMNQMVLNNLVGSKYKDKLKQWYDQWEKAYSGDKRIDASEIEGLRESYNKLIKDAAEEVEALRSSGIVSAIESETKNSDQTTTMSMAEKVTYDQFDTYLGIATAQQIAQEQIKDRLDSMTGEGFTLMGMNMEQMVSISSAHRDIADESRDILAKSYLELQEANEHLGKIEKSVETINTNVSETRKIINDRL